LDLFVARAIDASRFLSAGWNVGEECLTTPEIEKICWRLNKSGDNEAARAAVQIASYRFAQKDGEGECSADLLWLLLMNPKVFRRNNDNMISYYWETLAKVFRKRFPERDIKLLRGIFRNHCRSGGPDSFSSVFDVIVEICRRHPKESWAVVARALENSERSWSISSWLGEPRRSESKETDGTRTPTPIDCFDPTQILDWIDEDKPSRADLIMQALPKSLEQGRGGDLTRGFIELFGPQSVQARSLIGQFYSGTRWGPDSVYYSKQRDTARTWIDSTTSSNVREWIGNFISTLSQSIERARIQEERGF
jgi:hypothetical protein